LNIPDKHKSIAYAWADGAQIEIKISRDKWEEIKVPTWSYDSEYRIKPKKVRFWQNDQYCIFISYEKDTHIERLGQFRKWLTDWVDYVG